MSIYVDELLKAGKIHILMPTSVSANLSQRNAISQRSRRSPKKLWRDSTSASEFLQGKKLNKMEAKKKLTIAQFLLLSKSYEGC